MFEIDQRTGQSANERLWSFRTLAGRWTLLLRRCRLCWRNSRRSVNTMYVVCGLPRPHVSSPFVQQEERMTVTVVDLDQVQCADGMKY